MKLIEQHWLSYRTIVVPKDTSPVQVSECRRAFYAGAQSFYSCMLANLSGGGDRVTPRDMALLNELERELEDFAKAIESRVK